MSATVPPWSITSLIFITVAATCSTTWLSVATASACPKELVGLTVTSFAAVLTDSTVVDAAVITVWTCATFAVAMTAASSTVLPAAIATAVATSEIVSSITLATSAALAKLTSTLTPVAFDSATAASDFTTIAFATA